MATQPHYRPDIDGLRAIAVLLVVGFHAFPRAIPGGYIGVDIFFVISGFLITGLLLHDLEKKEFSFSGFYARRIRRIFPSLIIVLAASLAAGWILLLPREFSSLGLNVFGGAAFSSNLVQLNQTGYFDLSAAQKPLLHLWSLGVEEQFYIAWPILMLLTFTRRLSIVLLALCVLIISFVWNVARAGSPADFYLPLTRAWELMAGGIIAAVSINFDKAKLGQAFDRISSILKASVPRTLANIGSRRDLWTLLGLGLITIAVAKLDQDSSFPGWWALLPIGGTALIVAAEDAWINRVLLAHPAAVAIGLISYPLYLWHWPLLAFANVADPSGVAFQMRLAAILAAGALAWLTYNCVERPLRTGGRGSLKVVCLCVAMTVLGVFGLVTFYRHGFPDRIPPAIRDITTNPINETVEWRLHTCLMEVDDVKAMFAPQCLERGRRPLVFLWGDSLAAALYPGLKVLQQSVDFGVAQYTTAGCPPLLSFPVNGRPHCVENNDFVFSVLRDAHPDIVVLYSAWNYGDVFAPLNNLVLKLRALGIPRIVIMGPPPNWDGGLPKAAYDYYAKDPLHRMLPMRSSFRVSENWYGYEQMFHKRVQSIDADYISTWDAFCNGRKCLTRVSDSTPDLIVFDYAHATLSGSTYLAHAITPCLFPESKETDSTPTNVSSVTVSICTFKRPVRGADR